MSHVYWIGGGSGAGKSTVARRLADRYGMRLYDTDAAMLEHTRQMLEGTAPHLAKFAAMDMDERWVSRDPRQMLDNFHWFHGEGLNLIVEDLLALGADRPVVAEGFRLLPALVRPLLAGTSHAVWLLPTPGFRQAIFDRRGGTGWGFIAKTSDPARALSNLLRRDAMFTDRLAMQTRRFGLQRLDVGSTFAEKDLERKVAEVFGLPQAHPPPYPPRRAPVTWPTLHPPRAEMAKCFSRG